MTSRSNAASRILRPKDCALLIIDLQTKLMPAIFEAERVTGNCVLLLRLAQIWSMPAVVTTQYAEGLGPLVPEVACAMPGITPLDKTSFGCFADETFVAHLEGIASGRHTLLVAGVESHICVMQTALAALNAGCTVHLAGDAISSRTRENWEIGLHRMERAGAVLSSTEMMIYELLGKSGTPEFKAILPLLK
ncbi:MAG TPA: hydrolase [Terriglobia bacterium]|nr:hydrolase [Terriglobia bacterium]